VTNHLILLPVSTPETQVQPAGWYDDPAGQARSRYWDGRHWTHQTTNAKNPGSGAPGLGSGFARLGDWLGRGMTLIALAAVAVLAVIAWAASTLGSHGVRVMGDLGPDSTGFAGIDHGDAGTVGVALLVALASYSLVSMITGLAWVVWQYQLAESAPGVLRRGPMMQVASWFIPVVGYWWPYQNMVDLWNAYGAGRDRQQPEVASGIGSWWGALLGLPFVAGLVGGLLLATADAENVLSRLALFYAGLFASSVVSALLARGVVNRLSWRALEFCASVR
jgi:hypothetical protein